ncbi:unnamed protein product [Brassica napus]|uniref:(rape) hypothetical protein n=1 Tax=Brassica napus TaxID=3708 RepID=A0A816T1S4_BRANA|nr:unnamed protein product [Brassica napus]
MTIGRCGGWDVSLEWMELSVSGSLPPPRCGHTATMVEKRLLVFGGRVTAQWKRLPVSNDEPPPRVSLRCRGGLSPSLFCRVSSGGFRFLGDESWVEVCSRRWCLSLVPISKGSVGCLEGVFYGFIHGISTSLITGDLPCLVLVLILLVNGDGPLHQMLVLVLHVRILYQTKCGGVCKPAFWILIGDGGECTVRVLGVVTQQEKKDLPPKQVADLLRERRIVMAEGVVSFGVEKLWDLLSRESERLQGVQVQVDDLKCQMSTLQSLLEDADGKRYESKVVRSFLEDVKDIVFDAEDIIESFLLKELSGNQKGIMRRVKRLSCFLVDRRGLSMDIEGITKRMAKVVAQMHSFGIQQIIYRSPSLQERQREIRQTYPKRSQKDLVGVEQSVKELVGQLVENDNIQVVSISGMGGIGKTTLARQVFHHDIVRSHFDGFAWICVSQDFKQKDIWQKLLQDLRPHDKGIEHMNENTLQAELFLLLETSRYLIVMDDVWKNEDWDIIKHVFPQERRAWKMILTSRNEGVGLHADPTCFPFRPKIFTPEESWKLCESIAFPRREITEYDVDEELEAMGKKMVMYCGGLPLAVKVLGGLLANKYMVEDWKRINENIQTQIVRLDDNNQDSVYRVLSMSYEDLPMQLKHCFLYLAHFPEDYKIQVGKLCNLWEAEGTITSSCDGATTRKIGEEYIDELVRRNMVMAVKQDLSCTWEYCQMHDMMREVCLYKAKEENFLKFIKVPNSSTSTINAHTPTRFRRLVVHGGNALDLLGRKSNQKARSVLGFGLDSNLWKQSAQGLRNLQLLRVLDLTLSLKLHGRSNSRGGRIPSSIGKLIHLRYLSLYMGCATHVPSSFRNLKLLIYLKICSGATVYLPSIFKEMVELRFLFLPSSFEAKTKLELGNLVNLEYLTCFRAEYGSITDFLRMTRLRTLYVFLKGRYTSEILVSSLCELRNLETLILIDVNEPDEAYYDVDFVWNFIHLRHLELAIHMPRLPNHSRFPPHLAHISLRYCNMEDDPLQILEKLLHLKSVKLTDFSFVGRKMVCSKGGFPQLCKLEIWDLNELEEWIVEEGSMPCLRTLSIRYCKKLKELPEGLKHITSLKELYIRHKNKEWKTKLVPGGESYHKVQHIPSVQLHYDSDE